MKHLNTIRCGADEVHEFLMKKDVNKLAKPGVMITIRFFDDPNMMVKHTSGVIQIIDTEDKESYGYEYFPIDPRTDEFNL